MSQQVKGTSQLALSAEDLPVRSRIGLAIMAADLAVEHLKTSDNFGVARSAFDLARRWFDGDRFDPDCFEEAASGDYPKGISLSAIESTSDNEHSAWLVLGSAVHYVAFQAYRALGACPSPIISEVAEDELDEIEKSLRALSPDLVKKVLKTGDYLKHHPDLSFAQLKASIS